MHGGEAQRERLRGGDDYTFTFWHDGQILTGDEARERIDNGLCRRHHFTALGMIAAHGEPRGLRVGARCQPIGGGAEALLRPFQFAFTEGGEIGQRHIDEFFGAIASRHGVTTDLPVAVRGGQHRFLELGGVRIYLAAGDRGGTQQRVHERRAFLLGEGNGEVGGEHARRAAHHAEAAFRKDLRRIRDVGARRLQQCRHPGQLADEATHAHRRGVVLHRHEIVHAVGQRAGVRHWIALPIGQRFLFEQPAVNHAGENALVHAFVGGERRVVEGCEFGGRRFERGDFCGDGLCGKIVEPVVMIVQAVTGRDGRMTACEAIEVAIHEGGEPCRVRGRGRLVGGGAGGADGAKREKRERGELEWGSH